MLLTNNIFKFLTKQMDPLNRTCVTCCTDVKSDAKPCCDCNAKRDACVVTQTSDEEEERNTRSHFLTFTFLTTFTKKKLVHELFAIEFSKFIVVTGFDIPWNYIYIYEK